MEAYFVTTPNTECLRLFYLFRNIATRSDRESKPAEQTLHIFQRVDGTSRDYQNDCH